MLVEMAFTRDQATKALKMTDNNMERAVEWIFSHPNDLGTDPEEEDEPEAGGAAGGSGNANNSDKNLTNGQPNYKLVAFISHMGSSHMVGHYVCHILKDGKWVIYNDSKIALSQNTPKGLGYLYLYQRVN